jgi:hypothetical protein
MSSIAASWAQVHVMQKRQEEKLKRTEEERVKRGETSGNVEERKVGGSEAPGKSKKVHPGDFPPQDSAGKPGETCHSSTS